MTQSICVAGGEVAAKGGTEGASKGWTSALSAIVGVSLAGSQTSIVELSLENRLLQLTGFLDPAAEKEKEGKTRLRRGFARLKER